jgi:hypothetical protein
MSKCEVYFTGLKQVVWAAQGTTPLSFASVWNDYCGIRDKVISIIITINATANQFCHVILGLFSIKSPRFNQIISI